MAIKGRLTLELTTEELAFYKAIADADNRSVGSVVKQYAHEAAEAALGDKHKRQMNVVDWMLKGGNDTEIGNPDNPAILENGELNGGRWFLEWLLLREPDWQAHHMTMTPRHWPIQANKWETRCWNNGGDKRSVSNHLYTLAHDEEVMGGLSVPPQFDHISDEDWVSVCERFRGCCGEKLRLPWGEHWDSICSQPEPS